MESDKRTVRHPFEGYPETREETDENGNPRFRVTAKVQTPLRAKIADKLGAAIAAAGTVASVVYVMDHNLPLIALLSGVAIWFLRPGFEKLCREALRRKAEMVLTAGEFSFRTWTGRWIVFDRAQPHSFTLRLHDLAKQERDQHEFQVLKAQQIKKIVQPRRYYQDSYHLIYEFLGQRNDITQIYSQPEAQAVQKRLRAIDDVLKALVRHGGDGTPLKPRDEWADGPGVIPETADR
jgi:hypothetical protein